MKFTCNTSDGVYWAALRVNTENGQQITTFSKAEGSKWGAPIPFGDICGNQVADNMPSDLQWYCNVIKK